MRKVCFSLIGLLYGILGFAQEALPVRITGIISDLKPGTWVYCVAFNESRQMDSVQAEDGKFKISMPVAKGQGDLYIIRFGANKLKVPFLLIYLDEGDINIKASYSLQDAVVTGGHGQADYNAFAKYKREHSVYAEKDSLIEKSIRMRKNNDSVGFSTMQSRYIILDSLTAQYTKQWVLDHKHSPIAALLIARELPRLNMDKKAELFAQLSPDAVDNGPAKRLAHSIAVNAITGIGKTAPDFTQPDTAGIPVSLKEFRGKYVLLDFWASWCVPCRAENPNVVAAYGKYHDKNFTVVSISLDRPGAKDAWLKAIHKDGLQWTQLSDLKFWNNAVAKLYDIEQIPSNLLIDPQGVIIGKNLRGEALNKKLHQLLD